MTQIVFAEGAVLHVAAAPRELEGEDIVLGYELRSDPDGRVIACAWNTPEEVEAGAGPDQIWVKVLACELLVDLEGLGVDELLVGAVLEDAT